MIEWMTNPEYWAAFLTLCALEIVLGIDNVIFISILAGRLPVEQRSRARLIGLSLAMMTRILLLLSIAFLARLTHPLFTLVGHPFSGRDLILIAGGLFLLGKGTYEIHDKLEDHGGHIPSRAAASFTSVIIQIITLDIIFSLDSVITAVGMVNNIPIMVSAVIIAVIFMMFFSGPISRFIDKHPTVKMLALSFLLLIGMALIADGLGQHIPKGYIYFAVGFSVFVELLNLRLRKKPVAGLDSHQPLHKED